MGGVLNMPRVTLGGWKFRLLWNGRAMIEWTQQADEDQDFGMERPERVAAILHLMAREASAACSVYGYDADPVPDTDELEKYLRYAAGPWEIQSAIDSINAAIMYGTYRDYKPEESDMVDIDTIELKKN